MNNEKLVETAVRAAVLIIVVPIVVKGLVFVGAVGYAGVKGVVEQVKFNKKMKQGIKDGSIVKIDGQYYEVEIQNVEEA